MVSDRIRPPGQAERDRADVNEERDDQRGDEMRLGEAQQRVAIGLDRLERQIVLAAEREEGDDDADEEREQRDLEPGTAAPGRLVGRRGRHLMLPAAGRCA